LKAATQVTVVDYSIRLLIDELPDPVVNTCLTCYARQSLKRWLVNHLGGLVGIFGFPEFVDDSVVTGPNPAFFDENGFAVENVGTPLDIEVEQLPVQVINGKDPKLEKAIQIVMREFKNNPQRKAPSSQAPIRARLQVL
jgi:hypothetical protein